jgi:hypothetical protein
MQQNYATKLCHKLRMGLFTFDGLSIGKSISIIVRSQWSWNIPSGMVPNTDPVIQDDGCLVSAFMARTRAGRPWPSPSLAFIDDVGDDQGSTTLGTAARSNAQSSMSHDGISYMKTSFYRFIDRLFIQD